MRIQLKTLTRLVTAFTPGLTTAALVAITSFSSTALAFDRNHNHAPTCEIEWPKGIVRGSYIPMLWPGGIVPFEFDANVNATNQQRTLDAMAVLEAVTNIDFVTLNGEANYIHVQDDTSNRSAVGMIGGEQILRMTSWSSSGPDGVNYVIVHELMHALGFFHEQSRTDRDTFVQINLDNIQDAAEGNFDIEAGSMLTSTPYDFQSVLHYDQCAFSDCCPAGFTCDCPDDCLAITVLAPNEDQQDLMGQRNRLSCLDRAGLMELYGGSAGQDCNTNGVPDQCDIEDGTSPDCDLNGVPDECESTDPDGDGVYNNCDNCPDTANPMQLDCDGDGTGDVCEIADGNEGDCNANGIPDNCDIDPVDPDGNGVVSPDCQSNGIPDECDIDPADPDGDGLVSDDCQPNGVPDECDIADGTSEDCNRNAVPDECDIADGTSEDCNTDGIPDECQLGNCLNQYLDLSNGIFSDLDCEQCQFGLQTVADQFIVDAPTTISGVKFWGVYFPDDIAAVHDAFIVRVWSDNAGLPDAVLATYGPVEADLKLDTGIIIFGVRVFEYTIDIPDVNVGAGTWWIEIINDSTDFGSTDSWAWVTGFPDAVHSVPGSAFSTTQPENWTAQFDSLALQVMCSEPNNDCNSNGIPDDCELGANDCNNNNIPDDCDTKPDGDPSIAVEQDECVDAMLVCPGFDYVGNNLAASNTDGIFFCGLFYGIQDVYYRYRPAWDGLTYIRVEGPPIYWLYSVYDDCPTNGGEEITCNEQGHFNVTFNAQAGQTYYIRIASWGQNPLGAFEMNIVGPNCALADNDLNGNGVPDECECPADVNGDMAVDMLDFMQAVMDFGQCFMFPCNSDVDGNGVVDNTDLSIILNSIGPCPLLPPRNDVLSDDSPRK